MSRWARRSRWLSLVALFVVAVVVTTSSLRALGRRGSRNGEIVVRLRSPDGVAIHRIARAAAGGQSPAVGWSEGMEPSPSTAFSR